MSDFPEIDCTSVYPTLPVTDLVQTIDFYKDKLGFDLRFAYGEPPTHAAVSIGQATVHFFTGQPAPKGHWIYLDIRDNIDDLFRCYTKRGVNMMQEPKDMPWGMREFNLRDLNGYELRFGEFIHQSEPDEEIDG